MAQVLRSHVLRNLFWKHWSPEHVKDKYTETTDTLDCMFVNEYVPTKMHMRVCVRASARGALSRDLSESERIQGAIIAPEPFPTNTFRWRFHARRGCRTFPVF